MPTRLMLLALGAFRLALVLAQDERFEDGQTNAEEVWEYEPRIWAPEPHELDDIEAEPDHQQQVNKFELLEEWPWTNNLTGLRKLSEPNESELRSKSNFWLPSVELDEVENELERRSNKSRRKSVRQLRFDETKSEPKQRQKPAEPKCTQFRADIRETVICDKRRCDKLDFEWPEHDNQIVHMETTKHGMRFYRADYAFAGSAGRRSADKLNSAASLRARHRETLTFSAPRIKPVKFDLLAELFKPKPADGRTTVAPVLTPLPATSEQPTSPAPNSTTPAPDPAEAMNVTESGGGEQPRQQALDSNATRLVTTIRLDTRQRAQTMLGFGGALSDSTCRNIKALSADMAKSLMEDYYGQRGLRYNLARMTMGSSDFSTTPYTNNDDDTSAPAADQMLARARPRDDHLSVAAAAARDARLVGDDDVEMKRFRLVDEDFEFKLPIARQAIATSRHEIKFFSSLWSPPIWMKNNSHIVHGWLKGDIYGPYYKALADYMVRWLEAYRKQGIEFWATTGLNEPVTGIKPFIFHNSLGITRDDYVTFIKLYLGPMLRQRNFRDLKLIVLDDNKGYAPQLARAVLADPEASKYVAGVGVHWYMNDEYENLNFLAKDFPDKFLLSTEACNGYLPFQVHTLPGNWDRGAAYMYDIIKVIQKNAAGWVDWNMALDVAGGPSWAKNNLDAAIIVNAGRDEYYKSPAYYAIGHFSRFVEPNSTRLHHRLANARYDRPLETVAFHTPRGYIVIVALNTNKHPVPFRIIVDQQLVRVVTLRDESFNTIIFKWKKFN